MPPPTRLLIVIALPFIAVSSGCGTSESPAPPAPPPQPVRVVAAAPLAAAETVRVSGLVAARDERRLSFKAGGVVARINFDEGDRVQGGAVLAEVALAEVDAQFTQAREQQAKAERDVVRLEDLHGRGLVARQPLDDARTALDVANAQLAAAEFNRQHARITAPGPGVVLRRLAEPGELVAAGTPVLLYAGDGGGWQLRAAVSDRSGVRLRLGDSAAVTLDAWPGRTFHGRIDRIAAASDAGTGTLGIEIGFAGDGLRMVSGLVGHAELTLRGEREEPLAIPVGALLEGDGDRAHVYVLAADGGSVRRIDIRTGGIRQGQVVVREGLAAGDRVVTEGGAWLADGSAVRLVP